jgi:hypothetical protein
VTCDLISHEAGETTKRDFRLMPCRAPGLEANCGLRTPYVNWPPDIFSHVMLKANEVRPGRGGCCQDAAVLGIYVH